MGQTELKRCYVLGLPTWPHRLSSVCTGFLQSACAAFVICVIAASTGSGRAHALNQDIVPEGVLGSRTRFTLDSYDQAIDRLGKSRNIKSYAIHTPSGNNSVSGSLFRRANIVDFDFSYGMSDSWNLSFGIPVGLMTQSSSLRTSGATAKVQAQVESVQSDSFTELGDLRLISLHRVSYTDWTGIIWGYGFSAPSGGQHSKYIGRPTFTLRSPGVDIIGLFHLTNYPSAERSRFDLELEVNLPRPTIVDTPLENNLTLVRGNGFSIEMGWQQEIDRLLLATFLKFELAGANSLDGRNLSDQIKQWVYGLSVGYGNLIELEQGPVSFPYQLRFDFEKTFAGFNVPLKNKLSISLTTFF